VQAKLANLRKIN